ncbi:MAG TPA: ferritin-like protein [Allosphingosinicella sp.]|jgi:hypothetical protein
MLQVQPQLVQAVRSAQTPEDLYDLVQGAIRLEHSTIPPYLCAYYSLKQGANVAVADIIRSIVVEEMLHMTIASNLLVAIGGSPAIDGPGFVPAYPGPLPMNVESGLVVHLAPASIEVVQDTFMRIEAPDDPIDLPMLKAGPASYDSIADFYKAVLAKLGDFGSAAFRPERFPLEVVDNNWFSPDELFPIVDLDSARRAVDIIVVQGEGTPTSPEDEEGALAHYYRFEQIVRGKALVKDSSVKAGWSFSGPPVVLDPAGVWPMPQDPKMSDYAPGSAEARLATRFNETYSSLLRALHVAFNGQPERFSDAMGLMYAVRLAAIDALSYSNGPVGLSFEYVPVS